MSTLAAALKITPAYWWSRMGRDLHLQVSKYLITLESHNLVGIIEFFEGSKL